MLSAFDSLNYHESTVFMFFNFRVSVRVCKIIYFLYFSTIIIIMLFAGIIDLWSTFFNSLFVVSFHTKEIFFLNFYTE